MYAARVLVIVLLVSTGAQSQEITKFQPSRFVRGALISTPGLVLHEVTSTVRDFATFRDPEWSALTLAQIGASSADAVTSLNNLQRCENCYESGPSRLFIGSHPDAHKYILGGVIEIGMEAVTAHYFRNRMAMQKWYWKALWELPQTFSLFEHARAADRNTALNFVSR
jgi:hypothetical protein